MTDTAPLGKRQKGCLEALSRYGYYPSGWVWDNHSTTCRILDSLVARGLAIKTERGTYKAVSR